jgi:hypothetical protein
LNDTVASPVPLAPLTTWTKSLEVAVQLQSLGEADTRNQPLPPLVGRDVDVGNTEYRQVAAG